MVKSRSQGSAWPLRRAVDLATKPGFEKAAIEGRAFGRDLVGLAGDLSRDAQQHRAAGNCAATGMKVQLRKDRLDLLRLLEIACQKSALARSVHRLDLECIELQALR